ncbi:hypothetical protein [Sphingomonas hengshuiensis]|nr:hypothetical protein [Sphingomonas hengshuiensis]
MADKDDTTELGTDRARAGTTVGMTRYVLGISLVLVIIAFAIILWS